ncbi:enoyl-CoA hydratase-related protein [Sphingomonas colocasiae]|uniref:Enoyl-CoA hydratase/isomerase family protein n=1 Tax=Sphingomonas colocasiae TaxID=1848973 RepID=A0ABS7PSN3_9SPHN|nr:enoyl-CoA hydratase-related protein [Sphingomonas colocasiae]MBY8824348.1 enoyl-CoA hydratase/isomerase family protein [Sphingomonas colocasiae]
MTAYRTIRIDHDGAVATITLNDPGTLNAASFAMTLEITAALEAAVRDGARAIIVTGAGRGFCSGANLGADLDPHQPGYDAGAALDTHYAPLMRTIRDLDVPLVTAVNGAAAGIGCSIALAGDIVLAAETSYFLQAFRRIGLVPDGGSAYLLAHAAGRTRAMEMMLLGEKLPAARALEWGLVTRVLPADALMEEAWRIAADLASGPTLALRGIRQQCWRATETGFDEMLAIERRQQRDAGRTADHREGIAAFLGKRPAVFTGT